MRANAFPITLRAIRPNRSSLAPPLHHHDFYPSHPPPSELFARPNFRVYRVYRGFMDKKRFDRDPEGKKYLLYVEIEIKFINLFVTFLFSRSLI